MKIFSWIVLAVAATVGVYGAWFVVGMYLQSMSGTDFTIRIQITMYYVGIMAMLSILYFLVRPAKVAPPPPPEVTGIPHEAMVSRAQWVIAKLAANKKAREFVEPEPKPEPQRVKSDVFHICDDGQVLYMMDPEEAAYEWKRKMKKWDKEKAARAAEKQNRRKNDPK